MGLKMTPKERAHTALERREPDRVPLLEAWTHAAIIEKILNRPFKDVHDVVDFHKKLEIDFIPISFGSPKDWKLKFIDEKVFMDEWGRKWRYQEGMLWGFFGFYIDGTIKTPEQFAEFEFPDPFAPGRIDDFITVQKECGDFYAVAGGLSQAVLERSETMLGLKEFLFYMYEKPSFVKEVLRKNFEFSLEIGKAFLDAGAEFILIGDDVADNHGPFMPPKLYEEFIHPYSKDLAQSLKKRGAKIIRHTDGYLMPIIEYFFDMGIDGLHPIEPEARMDIVDFKQKYGDKISVVGGVDVARVLPFGSEEDVRQSIIDVIKGAGTGGGLVLASTNSLHSFVPDINKFVKNVLTYIETAHKFGTYPIQFSASE